MHKVALISLSLLAAATSWAAPMTTVPGDEVAMVAPAARSVVRAVNRDDTVVGLALLERGKPVGLVMCKDEELIRSLSRTANAIQVQWVERGQFPDEETLIEATGADRTGQSRCSFRRMMK